MRVGSVLLLGLLLALLTGCAQGRLIEMAEAMQRTGMSHCLYARAAVPPYGYATLLGKTGDLDCMSLWQEGIKAP